MGCLNFRHNDNEFADAISACQNGDSNFLYTWGTKTTTITDKLQIIEIIHQIFMISDSYFMSGTSSDLASVVEKCKPQETIKDIGSHPINPNVWFENSTDFQKLFNAFEKAFCIQEDKLFFNKKFRNTAEYFSCQRLDKPEGFWKAVQEFHYAAFNDENNGNLSANVDTWLKQVPKAKEFLEPYCPYIDSEPNFSHIAYAFLNQGYEIEKTILGLFPQGNPKPYNVFMKAAQYCEFKSEMNKNITVEDKQTKQIKI